MQLHREKDRFENLSIRIILVGLGTPKQAEAFRLSHAPAFTIVCDPRKILYKSYGLLSAGLSGIVSPRTIIRGLRALGGGHLPGLPSGDIFQLSGIFLIGKNMELLYAHYASDISDNPAVDELLRQVSALT